MSNCVELRGLVLREALGPALDLDWANVQQHPAALHVAGTHVVAEADLPLRVIPDHGTRPGTRPIVCDPLTAGNWGRVGLASTSFASATFAAAFASLPFPGLLVAVIRVRSVASRPFTLWVRRHVDDSGAAGQAFLEIASDLGELVKGMV